MRNHTATHLLHAALRERLGTHVRQAGSAVRPDKLRFDFTHGAPLSPEELRAIEDRVNDWIKASLPVRAMRWSATRPSALGAMALFGEKYGDWVRVVEVEDVSRELCGGTHVANTAEVGIFAIVSEGSSAANVRRIEALTGPAAIDWFRERSDALERGGRAARLAARPGRAAAPRRRAARRARAQGAARRPARGAARRASELAEARRGRRDQGRSPRAAESPTSSALLDLADRVKAKLGDAAVVLGGADDGQGRAGRELRRAAVERGLSAADDRPRGGRGRRRRRRRPRRRRPGRRPRSREARRGARGGAPRDRARARRA